MGGLKWAMGDVTLIPSLSKFYEMHLQVHPGQSLMGVVRVERWAEAVTAGAVEDDILVVGAKDPQLESNPC